MGVDVKVDGVMVVTGVVIIGGIVAYNKSKEWKEKFDPTSDKNVVYKGISNGISNVSDRKDLTLGTALYEYRAYTPLAWLFEGVGRLTGDLK